MCELHLEIIENRFPRRTIGRAVDVGQTLARARDQEGGSLDRRWMQWNRLSVWQNAHYTLQCSFGWWRWRNIDGTVIVAKLIIDLIGSIKARRGGGCVHGLP